MAESKAWAIKGPKGFVEVSLDERYVRSLAAFNNEGFTCVPVTVTESAGQAGEAVAWMRPAVYSDWTNVPTTSPDIAEDWRVEGHVVTPLYAHPPTPADDGMVRVPE